MSHGHALHIDLDAAMAAEPIQPAARVRRLLWGCVLVGVLTMFLGWIRFNPSHLWGAYYVNVMMWMGVALGSVMTAAIFQIVRAQWSPPIRRIAEANVYFLPVAFVLVMFSYFGKEHLFPWANAPMPGREWWMQPDCVYLRFAVLLGLLFWLSIRYVKLSLRSDIGMLREKGQVERYKGWFYKGLIKNWKGTDEEVLSIQRKLSCSGPVLIIAYVIIYSLFSFEMVMSMDTIWFSNMFGGFFFVGNIYMGWAMTAMLVVYFSDFNSDYAKTVSKYQLWDLGKLTFGFCMLWGYLFFSQYLPQWYGNLPEETAWLLTRTRGEWRGISYVVFSLCFVIPFIMLLSEDVKKNGKTFASIGLLILIGMWLEKYVIIMPQFFPDFVPLLHGGILEVGIFFGFLGAYGLCIQSFMSHFPFIPVSHPMTKGSIDW